MKRKPRIAVVLSGGGLKPLSALPLFKLLEDEQIPIDLLVGCSGGGIVVSLVGMGQKSSEISDIVKEILKPSLFKKDYKAILGALNFPFTKFDKHTGLIRNDGILRVMKELFGERQIEDNQIKTILHTTDFETGQGVGLQKGPLYRGVYATSAIYPFFPPIDVDGQLLFDGLYSSPMPLYHAVNENADIIISIDFLEKIQTNPNGLYECIVHTNKIFSKNLTHSQSGLSVVVHNQEIFFLNIPFDRYINIWDVDKTPMIFEAGQKTLEANKEELLSLIYNFDTERI
jgi:NTE family protein